MSGWISRFGFNLQDYTPKTIICWREGYTKKIFFNDLFAGITVGIIALPLAMAFAIGAGISPERGLYTAIVAGFLISLLGGSRVQIGGPTGAFVVIVSSIVERNGYEGLAIATLMAGVMMILMGLARFGVFLKFIPYPVTTGFTTGIALVIFSSQMKDFFGLGIDKVPSDFIKQWSVYFHHAHTWNPWAFVVASATLALIFYFRKLFPKVPGAIVAVVLATLCVWFFDLPVETIEKKFGGIPRTLPKPHMHEVSFETIQNLFPDAVAIALLGAIESLLSALVADGMTGNRHRSNCELVAQGFANMASSLFGGIPATGAIARTTANINMGAKTPFAGMFHAVTLLLLMLLFAPAAAKFPMPSLAAVLIYVAWNMSERDSFREILKGPLSDILVLLLTFFMTVLISLTMAVQLGVLLAAILFLKRMTDTTTIKICKILAEDNLKEQPEAHDNDILLKKDVPKEAVVFEINGPFFYTISNLLNEELRQLPVKPAYFILRMRKCPIIDATGIRALKDFHYKCRQLDIQFLISGLQEEVKTSLEKSDVLELFGKEDIFLHVDDALAYVRQQITKIR